jgi:hypothetical protein
LRVASRRVSGADVVGVATVAERDVQHPVGAERELAAVVIGLRLVDLEEQAARPRIGDVPAHGELHHLGIARPIRVIDVELGAVG